MAEPAIDPVLDCVPTVHLLDPLTTVPVNELPVCVMRIVPVAWQEPDSCALLVASENVQLPEMLSGAVESLLHAKIPREPRALIKRLIAPPLVGLNPRPRSARTSRRDRRDIE